MAACDQADVGHLLIRFDRDKARRLRRGGAFATLTSVERDSQDGRPVALAAASVLDAPGNTSARVERIWHTLRRAMARTCPAHLAALREDLVQEALLRVLERESTADSPVRSASYLWRVAFSVVVDELRRQRVRPQAAPPEGAHEGRIEPRPDLAIALRTCLLRLAESRRLAVTLHLQGFTMEEAGRMLGWDTKRVRNLVFRGIEDLRRCLGRGDIE